MIWGDLMNIHRDKYLQKLINRMNNGLIKLVTGIRHSGKSYLIFNIFKNYLLKNKVDEDHIITVELDRVEYVHYREPLVILDYIKSQIKDDKNYYILLDEVQMLKQLEAVLDSLWSINNVDIYLTLSNTNYLSGDILRDFMGRCDEIHVYPLTFKEFSNVYNGERVWKNYYTYGGLPLVCTMETEEEKTEYLTNLFEESYIKDILERNSIEKTEELNDLINILASSTGLLSNPSKILESFKSLSHSSISFNTIVKYIDHLKETFIIKENYRYDVKARKHISTPLKYYFEDVGLRNARLGFRQLEEKHLMENIIYNELRYRGFSVNGGMVLKRYKEGAKQFEIDFIATLGRKRCYIQSALSLLSDENIMDKKQALLSIRDHYDKIILVRDDIYVQRDETGITIMSIYDFLLNENSLEL